MINISKIQVGTFDKWWWNAEKYKERNSTPENYLILCRNVPGFMWREFQEDE